MAPNERRHDAQYRMPVIETAYGCRARAAAAREPGESTRHATNPQGVGIVIITDDEYGSSHIITINR